MAKQTKKKTKPNRLNLKLAVVTVLAISTGGLLYSQFSVQAPALPSPPLKQLAAKHNIDLGVLVYEHRLNDRIYPELVSSQFGFATIDGGAHLKELRPSKDVFDYSKSDAIVEFAEDKDMAVQLHHLVWGDAIMIPKWLMEGNYSKDEILDIMRDHITNVVKRYKGRVREYMVVNEAFTEAQHIYGLRSWLADRVGNDPKIFDDYFIWARQADPDAKLILNDFYNETKNNVSDAMYDYAKAAKARGVPIDGIGMQMHINASNPPPRQALIDNMKRFGDIGLPVYITEFDVNSNSVKGSDIYKDQLESQIMYEVVRACVESKVCVSFNVFGLTMKNDIVKTITRANSRDLLFDSRYRPQPSLDGFRRGWLEP